MYNLGPSILSLLIALVIVAINLTIMWWVTRTAVRAALLDQYKVIKRYEQTGDWNVQRAVAAQAPGQERPTQQMPQTRTWLDTI